MNRSNASPASSGPVLLVPGRHRRLADPGCSAGTGSATPSTRDARRVPPIRARGRSPATPAGRAEAFSHVVSPTRVADPELLLAARRTIAWPRAARRRDAPSPTRHEVTSRNSPAEQIEVVAHDGLTSAANSSRAPIAAGSSGAPIDAARACRTSSSTRPRVRARRRLAVDQVVAQLERLAQRPAEGMQCRALRNSGVGEGGADRAAGPPPCRRRLSGQATRRARRVRRARPATSRYWPSAMSTRIA